MELLATDLELLRQTATAARQHSYCPYSGFAVGAAVLARDGRCWGGTNLENAAYSPTLHAEQVAVARAMLSGVQADAGPNWLTAVYLLPTPEGQPVTPCGLCRQALWEFAAPDAVVVLDGAGGPQQLPLAQLFPRPFGPADLS